MGGSSEGLDRKVRVTGAVVDTRLVKRGDAFFALKGEYLDGHDFAREALLKGASVVVVDRPVGVDPKRQIVLADPMKGLIALSGWVRDVLNPVVVGVTGSTGKTSV